jgi:hypothetical protein
VTHCLAAGRVREERERSEEREDVQGDVDGVGGTTTSCSLGSVARGTGSSFRLSRSSPRRKPTVRRRRSVR